MISIHSHNISLNFNLIFLKISSASRKNIIVPDDVLIPMFLEAATPIFLWL